jgi:hypothetical protein
VFCSSPIDVGLSSGTTLYYYGSGLIKSVVTVRKPTSTCDSSAGSPWKDGLEVQLYSDVDGGGNYIGSIYYGHVQSPIADGTYNTPSGTLAVGTVPGCRCSNCTSPCSCYDGAHSHIEGCSIDALNSAISCGATAYGGTSGTWLYRWVL